jgi:regulator of protease activity HflC (stomatin/prohibitin superfamily)
MPEPSAPQPVAEPARPSSAGDPFRGVLRLLFALAVIGAIGALGAAIAVPAPAVLDAVVMLGLAAGVIAGTAKTRALRRRRRERATDRHFEPPPVDPDPELRDETSSVATAPELPVTTEQPASPEPSTETSASPNVEPTGEASGARQVSIPPAKKAPVVAPPSSPADDLDALRTWIAGAAITLVTLEHVWLFDAARRTSWVATGIVIAACLAAAGAAGLAARYLTSIEIAQWSDAPALGRGARVTAWLLVLVAIATAAARLGVTAVFWTAHLVAAAVIVGACIGLLRKRIDRDHPAFPLELGVLAVFGARPNMIGSMLDAGERRLGIDLRSTWALTVVRRSILPLALGLAALGWLSTTISIVHSDERAFVERFGVPIEGPALSPGIHVHWPWPIDHVARIPVQRVRSLVVGHEGEESGPENVLWARQHAANEYTLLLGNGRDLITVDATVQYRVVDPRAWAYACANPSDALRAIAYRTVMRATVDRTLADALSENVATLTKGMRETVQHDADELGLGVEVIDFTIGGMHPPVAVAASYQAVVSAELGKVTAVVDARAERNRVLPNAEAEAERAASAASAEAAERLARAAGEAWSFRALEAQYNTAPEEYRFRRRLETLENGLAGRELTIIDDRILKDGGGLWLRP